ncbi:MAG: hypothetical protein ACK5XN_28165, partial [Bacteroidota bacterium]
MQHPDLQAGRALFFCPPADFANAANAFVKNEKARELLTGHAFTNLYHEGGTLDFITTIWNLRQQPVSLDELFLENLTAPTDSDSSAAAVATYLALRKNPATKTEEWLRRLGEQWVNPDPVRRRTLLHATIERSGYEQGDAKWRRTLSLNPSVRRYASLLRDLLKHPATCRSAALSAEAEGLMSRPGSGMDWYQIFSITYDTKPEDLLGVMDGLFMLGDASEFRTWGTEPEPSSSLFARAADTLHRSETVCQAALAQLRSRKPSFGRDLALLEGERRKASNDQQRHALLTAFILAHEAEFDRIPMRRWPEISPLFNGLVTEKPDAFGQYMTWRRPWLAAALPKE